MKTIFAAIAIMMLVSCTEKPSKAEEMNRKADSQYHADSIRIAKQFER